MESAVIIKLGLRTTKHDSVSFTPFFVLRLVSNMGKRRFRARLAWNLPDNLTFKGEPRTRKQQLELTKEKALDMMFNSGSDIPIIVRHGKEGFNRHGTATTYMDPDGSWWVVLTMDDSLKGTADVIQRVVAGELKEVSLGHDPETNRAMEVSLVLKGARQNTHIVREDDENEPANPLDAEELEVETSVISSHNGEKGSQKCESKYNHFVWLTHLKRAFREFSVFLFSLHCTCLTVSLHFARMNY